MQVGLVERVGSLLLLHEVDREHQWSTPDEWHGHARRLHAGVCSSVQPSCDVPPSMLSPPHGLFAAATARRGAGAGRGGVCREDSLGGQSFPRLRGAGSVRAPPVDAAHEEADAEREEGGEQEDPAGRLVTELAAFLGFAAEKLLEHACVLILFQLLVRLCGAGRPATTFRVVA